MLGFVWAFALTGFGAAYDPQDNVADHRRALACNFGQAGQDPITVEPSMTDSCA
jgi:hypothetical protein